MSSVKPSASATTSSSMRPSKATYMARYGGSLPEAASKASPNSYGSSSSTHTWRTTSCEGPRRTKSEAQGSPMQEAEAASLRVSSGEGTGS